MAGLIFVGIEIVFIIVSVYLRIQVGFIDMSLWD